MPSAVTVATKSGTLYIAFPSMKFLNQCIIVMTWYGRKRAIRQIVETHDGPFKMAVRLRIPMKALRLGARITSIVEQ